MSACPQRAEQPVPRTSVMRRICQVVWRGCALIAVVCAVVVYVPGASTVWGTAAVGFGSVAACCAALWAASMDHHKIRTAWAAAAVGAGTNAVLAGAWILLNHPQQAASTDGPPGWTITASVVFFATFLSIMCLNNASKSTRFRRACDVLTVSGVFVILIWGINGLGKAVGRTPALRDGLMNMQSLDNVLMTYALVSVVVASVAALRSSGLNNLYLLLPTGWLISTSGFFALMLLLRMDVIDHEGPLAIPLTFGYLMIVWTIDRGITHHPPPPVPSSRSDLMVPHTAMLVGVALAIAQWLLFPTDKGINSVLLGTMMVLVVIRNHLSFSENLKLLDKVEERERLLTFRAFHDELTGLDNRSRFFTQLTEELENPASERVAVAYIDLDGFKGVNDTYGHRVGDNLLFTVAEKLQESCSGALSIARLAGDEFAVVLQPSSDPHHVGQNIVHDIRGALTFDGHSVHVSASVGIAVWQAGEPLLTAEELLARADHAMYSVKQSGKNDYRVARATDDAAPMSDRAIAIALGKALDNGEVQAYLQPIVRLSTRQLVGFEALARWEHFGWQVPPTRFVDVAEQAGLLPDLTELMTESVCQQLAAWNKVVPHNSVQVGINIGGYSLRDDKIVHWTKRIIQESGARPDQIYVELTETIPIEDLEQAAQVLDALRSQGIQVALDDFGTGYNSISALLRLPISTVKIDRSMVSNIEHDEHRHQVVSSMVDLAHRLRMRVIAEGVETVEQEKVLMGLGVDYGQGALYGLAQEGPTWSEKVLGGRVLDIRDAPQSARVLP